MNKAEPDYVSNRANGAILGLAVGDAVGTTVEFKPRGTFLPVTDMVGGGPFNLKPGQWTDDTSMALCLASSLLESDGYDPKDQMVRYCKWWKEGYHSSTGECFDIGNTTIRALNNFLRTGYPYTDDTDISSSGNGCIMRLAPLVVAYHDDYKKLNEYAGNSAATTHGSPLCVESTVLFAIILADLINGGEKTPVVDYMKYNIYSTPVIDIAEGSYMGKSIDEIKGSGYVIESLEAALWCFHKTDNFRDAILTAVNLGDDADTTAAITGQLAGAYYGMTGIPKNWLYRTYDWENILQISMNLLGKAGHWRV